MERQLREEVAHLIRVARAEREMTQKDLAEALGVSPTTVGEYERAVKQKYSLAEALALEAALGISDGRILRTLGYRSERPAEQRLAYLGDPLTPEQERRVLEYITWVRSRPDRE